MASERLTGSEKRALLLWVAAGILGLLFAYKYFFQAFPEASVNFQVSRQEALARAQKFVTSLGENVSGYKSSIIFAVDEDAKVYLERQLGLREANRLMSSELNIWYWDVRFFKPLQVEEFEVRVSPSGQIVGYDHTIEEARAGPALDRPSAQSEAQNYLSAKLGMNLHGWDALPDEANSKKKPNRLDWTFTWQKHGFRAKGAPYRLQVTVQGDRVGGSKEILKVPETWQRSYVRLRSGNDTLALAFSVLYITLLVVAVWFGIKLTLQGQTRWRGAILLGLLVAGLLFLQGLNDWPLWSASYDTKVSYGTFLAGKLGGALLFAVLNALTISLVLPAAEPLYRSSWPQRLRLSKTFTLRGLRSKEFFSSAVVGLSLAAVHIGYVVGFYVLAARYFGAWAPQEVNYQESVNTVFPWISGAAIGMLASTNEEFTFRLFAIPFFTKFTKSRWLAVIVPAFLWSFLHSNYPQEPAYIRGIEIGLIGIVAGIVMLRWGILATLIWHYTVDASLVGLFLLRSNSLYFKVSGAVVAAAAFAPLLFAGVSYLTRGEFEVDEDLRNSATPPPNLDLAMPQPSGVTAAANRRYDALAPGMLALLAACLLAGGLIAWRLKPESIGDYLKLSVDAKTARARADAILRSRGVDPNSYKCAVVFADIVDPVTNEFLRERVGVARVNEIYDKQVPGALWQARYFRDSRPEEYAVKLKPDGSLFAVQHKIAEDAAGASLKKEEAVARAEKFLREEKKIDLSQWTLVESDSETRPHRVDHLLTWQQNSRIDSTASSSATGHAYVRVRVAVLGNEVTDYRRSYFRRSGSADEDEQASEGFSTFIKIPDDWRRKQEETTLPREALTFGIPIILFGGLGLTALILFLVNLRSEAARAIPWRRLSLWAAWGLVFFYLSFSLSDEIANWMNSYNTAIPLKTWLGILGIKEILGGPLSFGFLVLLFGVAWYYATLAFGQERLPGWARMPIQYYRDALWIGLGGSAGLLGLERLLAVASTHWPTVHRYLDVSFGQDFDAVFPAASIVGNTLLGTLKMTAYVAVIASFVAARIRQRWLRVLLFFVGVLAVVGGSWGSPADFAKQFLARLILLGVLVLGVRFVMRFNLLGCFLVIVGTSLVSGAAELLAQPDAFYRSNGYVVLIVLVLLFAWPVAAWRMKLIGTMAPSAGSGENA